MVACISPLPSDVHFVKPKSLCNCAANRSFAAQNQIQVSPINAVVLRKCDLTSLAFCPKTQTPIRAEKSRTLPIKRIGRERHGKPTIVKSVILKIPRQTTAAGSGVDLCVIAIRPATTIDGTAVANCHKKNPKLGTLGVLRSLLPQTLGF